MKKLNLITALTFTAILSIGCASEPTTSNVKLNYIGDEVIAHATKKPLLVRELSAGEGVTTSIKLTGKELSIRYRAASPSMKDRAKFLEFRQGGKDGELIAKVKVHNTVVDNDFITSIYPLLMCPEGEVDIYVEFVASDKKSLCYLDWAEFTTDQQREGKSLVDFFLPMEPQGEMLSEGIWGADNVLPRDVKNGLEDSDMSDWCYWDGGIVKGDDGKYHLYSSRWTQSVPHSEGWHIETKAIHAVSDNIMGPYEDRGLIWGDVKDGLAHNVFGLRMNDGRYAVVTSEVTDGQVFVSDTPDGPFKLLGNIEVDLNGFDKSLSRYNKPPYHMSNVQIRPRPEGKGYILIARSTAVMISEDNILGPYKIVSDRAYRTEDTLAKLYNEDPTMWYSGGMYHLVYNHWPSKISHHFTSVDGRGKWIYRGEAFHKGESKIFSYTNGVENKWEFIERPTAYVGEDGHVTHFIFSVIDVTKGGDRGNDNHGSKIVVVPFDGKAFDEYMQQVIATDK